MSSEQYKLEIKQRLHSSVTELIRQLHTETSQKDLGVAVIKTFLFSSALLSIIDTVDIYNSEILGVIEWLSNNDPEDE